MKKWTEIRKQGKRSYIWKYWVIFWGLSTAILSSLIMSFAQPADSGPLFPIGFIVFPFVGYFAGRIMWSINENKYADELYNER